MAPDPAWTLEKIKISLNFLDSVVWMCSPNASHYADFAVSHHSKITRSFTYFNVQGFR